MIELALFKNSGENTDVKVYMYFDFAWGEGGKKY